MKCPKCDVGLFDTDKFCSKCGYNISSITNQNNIPEIEVKKNSQDLDLVCDNCGTNYIITKNKKFIIVMALIGKLLLSPIIFLTGFFFLLCPFIAAVFLFLSCMHADGKLKCVSVKRCSVCNQTRLSTYFKCKLRNASKKFEDKLLNRNETVIVRSISMLNKIMTKYIKVNIVPLGTVISAGIFLFMLFATNKLALSLEGFAEKTRDLSYLGVIMDFGSSLQIALIICLILLFIATIVTNFISQTRLIGLSVVLGLVTAAFEILLVSSNSFFNNFTYAHYVYGERIAFDAQYMTDNINTGLIVSAVLMITVVVISHLLEKERYYLRLKSNDNTV